MAHAIENGHISGDGPFTKAVHQWLVERIDCKAALLTHSGTAALEMIGLLLEARPGDEVVMPSFTFVSTANAFVLRGATPVFVDVRPDTLNVDPNGVADALTPNTKAIVAVHYAGVPCDMDALGSIARESGVQLVEDAAQGIGSAYKGRPLGSFGALAALSFHETKNLISGEGGALLINAPEFIERAEIIREKGTDRSKFFRGEVDKYTWVDVGSSYLPSDMIAAFLLAQLERSGDLLFRRVQLWHRYNENLESLELQGRLRRPVVPDYATHNGHIYYILLPTPEQRDGLLRALKRERVGAVFHYVPLHSAPAAARFSRAHGDLRVTVDVSRRLLRLPLFPDLEPGDVDQICDLIACELGSSR
jgi:dTDP-4-amino-4,6-dideoxygalactose transaminase